MNDALEIAAIERQRQVDLMVREEILLRPARNALVFCLLFAAALLAFA